MSTICSPARAIGHTRPLDAKALVLVLSVIDHWFDPVNAVASYGGPERRRHVRHAVESTFWLLTEEGASILLTSVNVSEGGALLRIRDRELDGLAVGELVRFTPVNDDAGYVPEGTSRAEVVRRSQENVALRFLIEE